MVRIFFGLLIIVTIAWSGYWWIGSTAQQSAVTLWLEDRRAAGWVADYDELKVKGYPSRFDTRITNLNLADTKSGWAWSAPVFQALMLSYRPNHIIAVLPPTQTVSNPKERVEITSQNLRASLKFDADTDLALNALTGEMADVALASNAGWISTIKSANLATRQTTAVENSHDVYFQASDFKPARILKDVVDPKGLLPDVFENVRLDATAGFDAPWDRHAIEGRKPEFTALTIKDFSAKWGELEFQAKGDVIFTSAGSPVGKVTIRAKNWKDMLELGVSAGVIPNELRSTLEGGLGLLARLSGNPDTIDAPLSFNNGVMSIGPIPIGPAPKLRLNP